MSISNKIKDNLITIKEYVSSAMENFKYALKSTAAEVYILGALGGFFGTYLTTKNEITRSQLMPLAFSERDQLTREAKAKGDSLSVLMEYSLQTNDLTMKILEAHNKSLDAKFLGKTRTEKFADNLLDYTTLRHVHSEKYSLADLLNNSPNLTKKVSEKLTDYWITGKDLKVINSNLDKAWKDTHDDKYRTEIRTRMVTTTDANGNTHTHLETYTEQVYDHTDHEYVYNKLDGEEASKNLKALFVQFPTMNLKEKIVLTTITNADGEYAAEKSRRLKPSERLDEAEKLKIANLCVTGSTIVVNSNEISKQYPILNSRANEWAVKKNTSKYHFYKTHSHSDAGPIEFQVAEKTLNTGSTIDENINEMLAAINSTEKNIPILKQKITEFLNTSRYENKRKAKKLEKEIMSITKQVYNTNFKSGVDLDQMRGYMIALGLFGGLALGAALGAALDYTGNKFKLYSKSEEENRYIK